MRMGTLTAIAADERIWHSNPCWRVYWSLLSIIQMFPVASVSVM